MKRFQFKFAAVLKLRQARENEALRGLAAAQRAYQAELARKAELLSKLDVALRRREELGAVAVDIQAFHLEQGFIDGIRHRIVQADHAISRAARGVEKSMRTYLHARRETRVIEVLREKAIEEFKKEKAKKEQRELDDLTVMRSRFSSEAVGGGFGEESA